MSLEAHRARTQLPSARPRAPRELCRRPGQSIKPCRPSALSTIVSERRLPCFPRGQEWAPMARKRDPHRLLGSIVRRFTPNALLWHCSCCASHPSCISTQSSSRACRAPSRQYEVCVGRVRPYMACDTSSERSLWPSAVHMCPWCSACQSVAARGPKVR